MSGMWRFYTNVRYVARLGTDACGKEYVRMHVVASIQKKNECWTLLQYPSPWHCPHNIPAHVFRYEVRAYVVCEHGFGLRIWVRASDSALGFVFKVWCMIGVRIRVRVWGSKIIIIVFYYNPLGNERPPSIRTKTPRVHTQFTATLAHAAKSRNSLERNCGTVPKGCVLSCLSQNSNHEHNPKPFHISQSMTTTEISSIQIIELWSYTSTLWSPPSQNQTYGTKRCSCHHNITLIIRPFLVHSSISSLYLTLSLAM